MFFIRCEEQERHILFASLLALASSSQCLTSLLLLLLIVFLQVQVVNVEPATSVASRAKIGVDGLELYDNVKGAEAQLNCNVKY